MVWVHPEQLHPELVHWWVLVHSDQGFVTWSLSIGELQLQ
jgi:hypothetical protein